MANKIDQHRVRHQYTARACIPVSRIVALTDRTSPLGDCSGELDASTYATLTHRPVRPRLRTSDGCTQTPLYVVGVGGSPTRYLACEPLGDVEMLRAFRYANVYCHQLATTVSTAIALALDELLADQYYSVHADHARALVRYILWVRHRAEISSGRYTYRCDTLIDQLLGIDGSDTTVRQAMAQLTGFDLRSLRVRSAASNRPQPAAPRVRISVDGAIPQVPERNDIEQRSRQRAPEQRRLFGGGEA